MNFCIGIFFLLSSVALNATDYQERAHELNIQAYNGALEIICRYKAFMEDYLEFTENEIEQGKNDYHYNEQEIKFHIRGLEKEKNFIDNLNRSDKKFTCNMLQRFLRFRFDMLDYRLALFRRGELIEDRSERMYEKISCNTTICQFYDQLITDIYLLASQNPLSYEIHFLISISPSLWPLLTKASEELPNPDQATYGKLNDRSSMGKNSDLYLFKTYYEKNKLFQLTVYGLGAPKNTTIATWMTPYDISRIDTSHPQYRKIGELIFPEWLQVTKVQPEERAPSQATYIHSEQEEALSHNTTVDFAETKIGEVTPVVKRQEKTIIMKEYTEVSCDAYFVDKTASSSLSKDTPNKESEKNVAQKSSAFPYLAPKGMRAFHPHTQTFRTNLTLSTGLQSKHLGTFNKLMESEYSSSLSYADFSSLWRAINGKNSIRESAGSSHKALLDADGKVVAGIFAHNKGLEYTKRTFAYLRDAVSRLGIDPVSEL